MNCSSCGHKLQDGDRFCPSCGAVLPKTPSLKDPLPANAGAADNNSQPGHQSNHRSKTPYYIAALFAASIAMDLLWGDASGVQGTKVATALGSVAAIIAISLVLAGIIQAFAKAFTKHAFNDGLTKKFLVIWLILLLIYSFGSYSDHEAKISALANTHGAIVKLEAYANKTENPTSLPASSSTYSIPPFSARSIDTAEAEAMQRAFTEIQKIADNEQSQLDIIRQKEKVVDLDDALSSSDLSMPNGVANAHKK